MGVPYDVTAVDRKSGEAAYQVHVNAKPHDAVIYIAVSFLLASKRESRLEITRNLPVVCVTTVIVVKRRLFIAARDSCELDR